MTHRLRTLATLSTASVGAVLAFAGPALADEEPPATIELTGVVRDFREHSNQDGHTDFERRPNGGFGQYCGNISETLGMDGKPVFVGGGFKVKNQWKDASGRPICYALFDSSAGDVAGLPTGTDNGGIASAASFNSWYRDVPGVNMSKPLPLTLVRQQDGSYVFDDKSDPLYSSLGGFFPIEDQLFGNPGGSPDRNFHFTFELHTEFTYDASGSQVFRFVGDDDVWVFINGRLVIDLGGVHGATEQYVDLDRLGLVDGEVYTLDFFFAERHRTQSNFRITTNLLLESVELPSVTDAFD